MDVLGRKRTSEQFDRHKMRVVQASTRTKWDTVVFPGTLSRTAAADSLGTAILRGVGLI
jgi:hypothetical protein